MRRLRRATLPQRFLTRSLAVPEPATVIRGGLVSKAHILLYHSTLGSRVMQKSHASFNNAVERADYILEPEAWFDSPLKCKA